MTKKNFFKKTVLVTFVLCSTSLVLMNLTIH